MLPAAIVPAVMAVMAATPNGPTRPFVFHHEAVIGTSLELHVRADTAATAERAEAVVLAEIDRLSDRLGNHDPKSEFRRWQAATRGLLGVSRDLFAVMRMSEVWGDRSGGAFNPAAGELTRLWERAAARRRLPTEGELAEAVKAVGRPAWVLDPGSSRAERTSDCRLTLDAIAKGYVIDRATLAAVRVPGVSGVMLNVGGDLRVAGGPVVVAIPDPRADSETGPALARIHVADAAVATSGNAHRGFEIDGRRYSHVFDPRTGRPVDHVLSATVVADNAADADALATICLVLSTDQSLDLVASTDGAECLLFTGDGRRLVSDGWAALEDPAGHRVGRTDAVMAGGRVDHELVIEFEVNKPEVTGRYRRPYVAVWVEDADGFPVRTLALWIQQRQDRWLPDLRRWYRDDQARRETEDRDLVPTVSRATKPPGRYTLVWDGTDDSGEAVKPGTYTVLLEAAREGGTYKIIRERIELPAEPFTRKLTGNVEIKSATLKYRAREER